VPFGEFIPFEGITGNLFDILGLQLTNTLPGEHIKPINAGNIRISASICYEIAFPELIRKTASESNLIVTISNDTWFGSSYGPIQHLEIAQNRALEHKKTLLRSTNSGISAFISKNGEIIENQGYFEEKLLKKEINLYKGKTFYAKYGNLPLFIIISVIFLYIVIKKRKLDNLGR
jgi:apolipoprotein N-acyltransferase